MSVKPTIRERYAVTGALWFLLTVSYAAKLPNAASVPTARLACDSLLRNGEFEKAEQCYLEAASVAPDNARAQWGLGRVAQLQFRRREAWSYFATAFRLDAGDPEIVLSYAEVTKDPGARAMLYKRFLALAGPGDSRIPIVLAKLRIDYAIGARKLNHLTSPYHGYRFKLLPFLPANSTPNGALLKASLNGSRPLRLLLDTGATGIVLSGKFVRDVDLEWIAGAEIGGFGGSAATTAQVALARSLAIDDFRLENCLVEVSERAVVQGADGIMGADVFQEFLLRLDARSQVLKLLPFEDYFPAAGTGLDPWLGYDPASEIRNAAPTPAYRVGHLLAVRSTVNAQGNGLFILDTGSAYNSVVPVVFSKLRPVASEVALHGAQGAMRTLFTTSPVEFHVSGGPQLKGEAVALDLEDMSQKEGVRIAGLLGYSSLSKQVVTINYRDGVVQFAGR